MNRGSAKLSSGSGGPTARKHRQVALEARRGQQTGRGQTYRAVFPAPSDETAAAGGLQTGLSHRLPWTDRAPAAEVDLRHFVMYLTVPIQREQPG